MQGWIRRNGRLTGATAIVAIVAAVLFVAGCSSAPPPAQVGVVRGIAVDTDGTPLPGITVSLSDSSGKLVQTVTTGPDGAYEFPAVPIGQYQILSTFGGYTTPTPVNVKVTPSGLAMPPRLVLAPPPA